MLGSDVSRSLSPRIFHLLKNIPLEYEAISLKPEEFSPFISKHAHEFSGFNITAPFKEAILPHLDVIDPDAKAMGAVNVVVNREGMLHGYNTDYRGIIEPFAERKIAFGDKTALIFGAGGAAKAVVYALVKCGVKKIFVLNRTIERAQELQATSISSSDHIDGRVDIVINAATSLEAFELSSFTERLSSKAVAFDINYTREDEKFKKITAGCTQIRGLEMLIWQALFSWELWFLPLDNKHEIKKWLQGELESGHIYLSGFMGAGKSVVGKAVAKRLSLPWIDLDREIEKREGCFIPEIFSTKGEEYFRTLEENVLREVELGAQCVVSLGGGTRQACSKDRTIFLNTPFEVMVERIKRSDRPLANSALFSLYQQRLPRYLEAKHHVNTEGHLPEEVAARIVEAIRG